METRSIVLTALILAMIVAGGIFYGAGRQSGIVSTDIATRLAGLEETADENTEVAVVENAMNDEDKNMENSEVVTTEPVVVESEPEVATENGNTDDKEPETLPDAEETRTPTVAGVSDVAPTAETGASETLLLVALLAIVVGISGIGLALREDPA